VQRVPKPFKLKFHDIIVSPFHPLSISHSSQRSTFNNQEFSIEIIGEDNKTIIHRKVVACVFCVLNKQDAQATAHAEQQQLAQNPPSYTLSSHHQNVISTGGPSNTFNFSGQGPTKLAANVAPRRNLRAHWHERHE